MSQYAALGAARLGCSPHQILQGFFPDAQLGTTNLNANVRVGILPNTPRGELVSVTNVKNSGDKPLPWRIQSGSGEDLDKQPPPQPPGAQWTVHWKDGGFVLREGATEESTAIWPSDGKPAGTANTRLFASLADTRVHLPAKGYDYARGTLEFTSRGTSSDSGMSVVVDVPSVETYLYGLAEVPSGWDASALAAQAIAGRSFVVDKRELGTKLFANCNCTVYDSTSHQVYSGWSKEAGAGGADWVRAVDQSVGQVLKWDQYQDGTLDVVPVYYSSSHGGHSTAAADIWRSSHQTAGYLDAVDLSTWEQAAASSNPYHRWSAGFTQDELLTRLGMDSVASFEVVERSPGGRPCTQQSPANPCSGERHGVVVQGVIDGQVTTKTFDSEGIRSALGGFPRSRNGILNGLIHVDEVALPVSRLAGGTRSETAIKLAQDGWGNGSSTVVLARQDNPADALTGSSLAGMYDAPLLLTPQDALGGDVRAELQRLKPDTVLLLGGEVALSRQVADDVKALDIATVQRVQGGTRHGTAVDVATQVGRGDQSTAYLVRLRDAEVEARGWVDALSVAAVAARRGADGAAWPILGTEETLPDETIAAIEDLGITRIVPVGGPVTIPQQVLDRLAEMGVEVAGRLAGGDRYGTSRAVTATDSPSTQTMVIATGENFPDGLAAGPYAARTGSALLLVPTVLDRESSPWLEDQHPAFTRALGWEDPEMIAVGGPVAIETPVFLHMAAVLSDAAS